MTENPRRQLLRRARYATAGIVVTAVAGTAGLAAVAANATNVAGGTTSDGSTTTGTGSHRNAGTGITRAPAGQSQGGSNAS